MALVNMFGAVALDTTLQDVKTALTTLNATLTTQPLTNTQLRASPVLVTASALPLPTGAGTEATLQAILSLHTEIKQLTDIVAILAASILEKMPRVTANDQAAVSIEAGSVGISSNQTLATVTTVGNINTVGAKYVSPDNLNFAGAMHIYNNISVS